MTDKTLPARGINDMPLDLREALARHVMNTALQAPPDTRVTRRLAVDLAHRLRTGTVLVGDVEAVALIPHLPEAGVDFDGQPLPDDGKKSLRAASWMVARQPCGSVNASEAVAALNEGRPARTVGACLAAAHGHDLDELRQEHRALSGELLEAATFGQADSESRRAYLRLREIEEIFERYDPYDGAQPLRAAAEAAPASILEDIRFLADTARTAPSYDDPQSSLGHQPEAIKAAIARVTNALEARHPDVERMESSGFERAIAPSLNAALENPEYEP